MLFSLFLPSLWTHYTAFLRTGEEAILAIHPPSLQGGAPFRGAPFLPSGAFWLFDVKGSSIGQDLKNGFILKKIRICYKSGQLILPRKQGTLTTSSQKQRV
jgi:hypothetical protein